MSAPTQDELGQDRDVVVIDARGLNCPLPVLRLRKRLVTVPTGGVVHLLATDRATLRDVPAFCAAQKLVVNQITEAGDMITFYIRKSYA